MARDLTLDDVSLALEPELQEEEERLWWGRIGEARREERGERMWSRDEEDGSIAEGEPVNRELQTSRQAVPSLKPQTLNPKLTGKQ